MHIEVLQQNDVCFDFDIRNHKTLILKEKSQSKKRTLIDIFQTRKFPVNISLTD